MIPKYLTSRAAVRQEIERRAKPFTSSFLHSKIRQYPSPDNFIKESASKVLASEATFDSIFGHAGAKSLL
jgi:hypothetical protein